MMLRLSVCILLLLGLAACGGGGGGPTGPTPSSEPTFSVTAVVFYDENGNGLLDASEAVRLPGVEVVVGSVSAKSATGGQAVVSGVRSGSQTVAIRTESLPPYFVPTSPVPVTVPQTGGEIRLPVRLPIGDNFPNVYMAFGDSITAGQGSNDGGGYVLRLQTRLGTTLGRAQVLQQGRDATSSTVGAARIPGRNGLLNRPAYTLILYGVNDWNDIARCQAKPAVNCFTIDNLTTIVETVKDFQSIPVLATLPPPNPAAGDRELWTNQMNDLIRNLARSEGAILADVNAAFKAKGNLPGLFADNVHPNDAGYDVLADAFFRAITGARSATASGRALPSTPPY